jgi:hypothetical protein
MNLYLITKSETSLLINGVFVTDIQIGVWNNIFNLVLWLITSVLISQDVLLVIEASSGSCKGSSLSVLEVDLDVILIHAFQHLFGNFKESKRLEL